MAAHVQLIDDDNAPERDLVENIARAMQHRPLMRRLANVEAEFSDAPPPPPSNGAGAAAPSLQEDFAIRPLTASRSAEAVAKVDRRIEAAADDAWAPPPSSAEWLGKAQRERNRARLRNAAAWLATFAIGGTIIATTALLLQP
jgi:hypothetical protein